MNQEKPNNYDCKAAAKAFQLINEANGKLNESILVLMAETGEGSLQNYKIAVGEVMVDIFEKLISPLITECPNIVPEGQEVLFDLARKLAKIRESGCDLGSNQEPEATG